MSGEQNPTTQSTPEKAAKCVFRPVKDNPDEAEKFVRAIFKHKPHNVDLVAAELAPLYGFGPNSNHDVLARLRAQSLFVSPEITEPLWDFRVFFTRYRWGLPLPKFVPTLALVHEHRHESSWTGPEYPIADGGRPEPHYARFIIRMLHSLELPIEGNSRMLQWLRNALIAKQEDDVCWVLFHALFYLQLKAMDFNKSNAPFKDRVQHYVNELAVPDCGLLSKWIAARRGFAEKGLSEDC
ncbi:hypothetical protein GQX73_g9941 [Xylaria multiplex]|uniref:Uncharacterized protein n=1 Tax=Xylaria multiplex TaxID=323545 RepID=A0A7C8MKM4_9PEZI|nr:hypothetical protein GQX73_g9941 [Xylaria multiplex]